jgi:hypothetical protein
VALFGINQRCLAATDCSNVRTSSITPTPSGLAVIPRSKVKPVFSDDSNDVSWDVSDDEDMEDVTPDVFLLDD